MDTGSRKGDRVNALRDLLSRLSSEATAKALHSQGELSSEDIDSLERLNRLINIRNATKSSKGKARPIVLALCITLIVTSTLIFGRLDETEIELDVTLSEISFQTVQQQLVSNAINLSSMGISGLARVEAPRLDPKVSGSLFGSEEPISALRLSVDSDLGEGYVTLDDIVLPVDSRVSLRGTKVRNQYRVSLTGCSKVLRANLTGPIQVNAPGRPSERFETEAPLSFHFHCEPKGTDLDLSFRGVQPDLFSPQLAIGSLNLYRVDQLINSDFTSVRRVSTVIQGDLYLEELNGMRRELRAGDGLQFEQSRGILRTIQLQDNVIRVRFHGHVIGMSTGSGETRIDLMPSYLEWLRARHGLGLLWGTTMYLFTLVVGILRWWRLTS